MIIKNHKTITYLVRTYQGTISIIQIKPLINTSFQYIIK